MGISSSCGPRTRERLLPEIDLQSALTTNVLKLGTMTIEAHADRLIVVQDPFVSGYECTACGGKWIINEVSYVQCTECAGVGKYSRSQNIGLTQIWIKCSFCEGTGRIPCPACDGKGAALVVPDASERRPTTGTIASVGPQVSGFARGDAVIYPSFAGHTYDLTAQDAHGQPVEIVLVILRESEVLAKISGHLEMRRVKRSASLGSAA